MQTEKDFNDLSVLNITHDLVKFCFDAGGMIDRCPEDVSARPLQELRASAANVAAEYLAKYATSLSKALEVKTETAAYVVRRDTSK